MPVVGVVTTLITGRDPPCLVSQDVDVTCLGVGRILS